MTKIYIDENLSPHLAEGLNILEIPNRDGFEVLSIQTAFGKSTPDEVWLPKIGQENGVVITQDFNIYRNPLQRKLYQQHCVGVFFLSPPSKTGYHIGKWLNRSLNVGVTSKNIVKANDHLPFGALPEVLTLNDYKSPSALFHNHFLPTFAA